MVWTKLDNYCIKCEEFLIAKYFTPSGIKYGISQFNKNHGYFNTAHEAKAKALEVNNAK